MLKRKLQAWMVHSGCTRKRLAELLHVSHRTVEGWLALKSRPIPAKMHSAIEDLIAPRTERTLSPSEKEFYELQDKYARDCWLEKRIERILVLSHRVMAYWEANYRYQSDDSEFFEEVTDLTMEIRDISTEVTALGAHHADCLLFDEYDEDGQYRRFEDAGR